MKIDIQRTSCIMLIRPLLMTIIATSVGLALSARTAEAASHRHASGLEVLTGEQDFGPAQPSATAQALRNYEELVKQNPKSMAKPYIDANGLIVVPVAKPSGRAKAARPYLDKDTLANITPATPSVAHSYEELEALSEQVIANSQLDDLPNRNLLRSIYQEPEKNRIVVVIAEENNALINALSALADDGRIAVRIAAGKAPNRLCYGRLNDGAPFWGGAAAFTYGSVCTLGFSWDTYNTNTPDAMITAGHCLPNGGDSANASINAYIGYTKSGRDESINTGVGSVPLTGSSVCYGDFALIRITEYNGGRYSAPYIYTGASSFTYNGPGVPVTGSAANNSRAVTSMCYTLTMGAEARPDGARTGEHKYVMQQNDVTVPFGANGWIRNLVSAKAATGETASVDEGDSGGPVYSLRSDGTAQALGVISGKSGVSRYVFYFTDIYDIYCALPGSLKRR